MRFIAKKYNSLKNPKKGAVTLGLLAIVGISSFGVLVNIPQPIPVPDSAVLFATDKIQMDPEVNILSGDILSNKKVEINEDGLVQGSMVGDKVDLHQNIHIFGNVEANKIKKDSTVVIDGQTITPRTTADFIMPAIPPFNPGTQNLTLSGISSTLNPGSYNKVVISPSAKVTINGGTHNLAQLIISHDAILNFSQPTTFNIADKFTIERNIIFNLDPNLDINDIKFNYSGNQLVSIGQKGFLAGKLLAPKAKVFIGQQNIWRGQILAKDVGVARNTSISREAAFILRTEIPQVDNSATIPFIVGEIVLNLTDAGTRSDAERLAKLVDGTIEGYSPATNKYLLRVDATTRDELFMRITTLENLNDPAVERVLPNYLLEPIREP